MSFKNLKLCITVWFAIFPIISWAGTPVFGPYISYEHSGFTKTPKSTDSTESSEFSEIKTQGITTNLFYPIELDHHNLTFIPGLKIWQKQKDYNLAIHKSLNKLGFQTSTQMLGPQLLSIFKKGDFAWFLLLGSYGNFTRASDSLFHESAIGVEIANLTNHLKLNPTDQTKTRIGFRRRHFPHGQDHLFIVEHKIWTKTNWSYEVAFPSHVSIHKHLLDHTWILGSAARVHGISDFEESKILNTFSVGHKVSFQLEAAYRLWDSFFIQTDLGLICDEFSIYHGQHKIKEYKTKYKPYIAIHLETIFFSPVLKS